jgi:hypothetical protein
MFYLLKHLLLLILIIFKLKCNNVILQWNYGFECFVCVFTCIRSSSRITRSRSWKMDPSFLRWFCHNEGKALSPLVTLPPSFAPRLATPCCRVAIDEMSSTSTRLQHRHHWGSPPSRRCPKELPWSTKPSGPLLRSEPLLDDHRFSPSSGEATPSSSSVIAPRWSMTQSPTFRTTWRACWQWLSSTDRCYHGGPLCWAPQPCCAPNLSPTSLLSSIRHPPLTSLPASSQIGQRATARAPRPPIPCFPIWATSPSGWASTIWAG